MLLVIVSEFKDENDFDGTFTSEMIGLFIARAAFVQVARSSLLVVGF
jgi:hypothetical protein